MHIDHRDGEWVQSGAGTPWSRATSASWYVPEVKPSKILRTPTIPNDDSSEAQIARGRDGREVEAWDLFVRGGHGCGLGRESSSR